MKHNAIIRTDSYKLSQWKQYPPKTTHISSYIESRGGEEKSIFFGLQAYIKQYLITPITMQDIDQAEQIVLAHGLPFNREGWEVIVREYGGKLPVEIQAVAEGTYMETSNVQVQITNTDPRLWWLPSYLETSLLRGVWYPSTVATKSHKLKGVISKALEKTSDIPVEDQIMFKLHDFGARGASSSETAILGGMAHLVNFFGTDTAESLIGVMNYYNTDKVVGFSIPASEHSTITSWGRNNESKAYDNMINQFAGDGKIYACVSDSYDIYKACRDIWGTELKDKIIQSGGTLVIRPDSGDPEQVLGLVLEILSQQFGYTENYKGYKVLPPYIRVIQGDGINEHSIVKIIDRVIEKGFSLDNIAFGMGGGLLQAWDRDTLKYAMKASAIRINQGEWKGFSKDPITDSGKRSKEGRLALICEDGTYKTVAEGTSDTLLRTVFLNGELVVEDSFESIRARAQI